MEHVTVTIDRDDPSPVELKGYMAVLFASLDERPRPLLVKMDVRNDRRARVSIDLKDGEPVFCKDKISWFKIPKYVHFLDIFPMTASQKIQKYKLREMAHELWPDA